MTGVSDSDEKEKKEYGTSVLNEERRPSTQETRLSLDLDPEVVPAELAPGSAVLEKEGEEGGVQERLPPPPDGGLHAWLKVFGGFLVYINVWGFTLCFGVFQAYYKDNLLQSSSPSAISWIGTVQGWLLVLVGVMSGPLFDLGYFRPMLYIGNFMVVLGIMMTSLSTKYWQVFLSQGICMGFGSGLLYVPSLALIGIWFDKRRALAMGIVMSGIAVGGISYILLFNRIVPTSFPWAMRAIGFVALFAGALSCPALLSGSSLLARPRKARSLFDSSALRDRLFLVYTACIFFNFMGYIVPYFYIPTYAKNALGMSDSEGMYMLVISIAGSFFGRTGSGVMAHYLGSVFTWMVCAAASGVLSFAWIGIKERGLYIGFCVVWGFFSAGLVTLPSAAFASICPDLSRLGTRLGMSMSVSSIATLVGAPIAGALLKTKANGRMDFLGIQVWGGVFLLTGAGWCCVLWLATWKKLNKGWRV